MLQPSPPARPRNTSLLRRLTIGACVAALSLASACSSTATLEADRSTQPDVASAPTTQSAQDTGGGEATAPASFVDRIAEFDDTALPSSEVTAAQLRVFRPNESVLRLPPVTAVVNPCGALSGADIGTIAEQVDQEFSFGSDYAFDEGEEKGAACIFRAEPTHGIGVMIGSADELDAGGVGLVLPIASGDVTATPWSGNSSVTVYSEDSFGVDTAFAAHTIADGYGILVYNSAGTGIDASNTGELFARLADAATAGVATAGAPTPLDPNANIQTARPCSLFEPAELEAFLGYPVTGEAAINGNECSWGDINQRDGADVRLEILHVTDPSSGIDELVPSTDIPGLHQDPFGRPYLITGDAVIEIRVSINTQVTDMLAERAAAAGLLQNLADRVG